MDNKLNELQENLAKDLVHLEESFFISKEQLDELTDTYSKVYDVITEIKSL